jgi:RNA polymerase sigma-70 factor (ECF subfamily)
MGDTRNTARAHTELTDEHSAETDHALIQRVKTGDQTAFEALFRRHLARVHRQASALLGNEAEAEEVVQEVFLTVYTKASQFRGAAAFTTWLYRLTANAAITKLRKRKRHREINFEDYLPQFGEGGHHSVRPVVDWSADLEAGLAGKELQLILRQALDELPPLDKAVVVLSDLEGMPNREIGQALRDSAIRPDSAGAVLRGAGRAFRPFAGVNLFPPQRRLITQMEVVSFSYGQVN